LQRAAATLLIGLVTSSFAVVAEYEPESWYFGSQTIIVGEVIRVADSEPRVPAEIDKEHWVFPHAEARVVVREVIKNESEATVCVGDTVAYYYPTSDHGQNLPDRGGVPIRTDLERLELRIGETGVLSMQWARGEWRSDVFHHFRALSDRPAILEIAQRMHPDIWLENAPAVVVASDLSITDGGRRELGVPEYAGWEFVHISKVIVVDEIVANSTAVEIAVGDTLEISCPVFRWGERSSEPDSTITVREIVHPWSGAGNRSVMAIRWLDGEWRAGNYYARRKLAALDGIRRAAAAQVE